MAKGKKHKVKQKTGQLHWLCLLLLFASFPQSSSAQADYSAIDKHARKAPKKLIKKLPELTNYLEQGAQNDTEKVRSFYTWMVLNIDYDHDALKGERKRINHHIRDILTRRKALCFGYAQLMQKMCQQVNIPCEIITGYSRGAPTSTPQLEKPDHAWNAVKIDGQWRLLDATWGNSLYDKDGNFSNSKGRDYFLPNPKQFILDHLPIAPAWQLLPCIIQAKQFTLSPPRILRLLQDSTCNYAFEDSLQTLLRLPVPDQKLLIARHSYLFNPTTPNAQELSASMMDYEYHLGQLAERLQGEEKKDSLFIVLDRMVNICTEASALSPLYPKQQENCIYNRINYAVALEEQVEQLSTVVAQKDIYRQMLLQFEAAEQELKALEPSPFVEQRIALCEKYIQYCKEKVE